MGLFEMAGFLKTAVASFRYPWLMIGNVARINLNGKYEISAYEGMFVENLVQSLFEFADKALENSKFDCTVIDTCYGHRIQKIYFVGSYLITFSIPCGLEIIRSDNDLFGFLKVEKTGEIDGYLKIGKVVFEEEISGYGDEMAQRLLELGARRKIYYPLYMLEPVVNGANLVFCKPDGEVVFEVSDKGYKLNYEAFGGTVGRGSAIVLKWLESEILKNVSKNFKEWELEDRRGKIGAGKFEISYDVQERKLIDFKFLLGGLSVSSISDGVKMSDWPERRIEAYFVSRLSMERFRRRVGEKLWEILKYLVF